MRVTYSVMMLCINIKILTVLQFYEGIAFLVEILENIGG